MSTLPVPLPPHAVRMDGVLPSATVSLAQRVREDRARGLELFDFTVGEPHWGPPPAALAAVKDGIDRGLTRYGDARGLPALREAIAAELRAKGIAAGADEIVVFPGGKQAIYMACQALLDPGDEAVIVPPCWVSYADIVRLAGGVPVEVDTVAEDRYAPREAVLRAAIGPRAKVILTNNPSNPTGAVWDPEVVAMVARVAAEHGLWVLDDPIYEAFNFTGRAIPAIGALADGAGRTITIGSFSKAFAMTGFRVGYAHAPAALVPQLAKLAQQSHTCLPAFVQEGAVAALRDAPEFPARMAAHYEGLRAIVREELGDIDPGPLEGAFYAFVDITSTGMTSQAFCDHVYDAHQVAVMPGSAFGAAGEGRVRVSYAAEASVLRNGIRRLAQAIREARVR